MITRRQRFAVVAVMALCIQLAALGPAQAAPEDGSTVKELNFVFLHGAGGTACSLQLLADSVGDRAPVYTFTYEHANPGTRIRVNTLVRCYPAYADIGTWANNVADSINKYLPGKKNLVLVGHSMGGKAALYIAAHNIGGLANRIAAVATINSPIKSLYQYYVVGGGSVTDYCQAVWYRLNQGACESVAFYDSSPDGEWVSQNKHWLAFISGESAPLTQQFNYGGVDGWPRDMDDGIVPISAQYSDAADVVYYGEYGHSDFGVLPDVARFLADQILRYLFGEPVECSVFARSGTFGHRASWLPLTAGWEDVAGEVLASSGTVQHHNDSDFRWQGWEDVVGECPAASDRSGYRVEKAGGFPLLTAVREWRWLTSDNVQDCRLYIRSSVAPLDTIVVDWSVYGRGLLPAGTSRDHYEIEITEATTLANVTSASWTTDEPRDVRLIILSEAEGPFRWFEASWRIYTKEERTRKVVDELPGETAP